jgi:hypothetical protein
VADAIVRAHGRVDVLVNNAGIAESSPTFELDEATWQRTIDIDLTGSFLCAREFGRRMSEGGNGGAIANVSSIAGFRAVRPENHLAYDVAKAGVAQMARVLAAEWAGYGIRVHAVAPGYTETQILRESAGRTRAQRKLGLARSHRGGSYSLRRSRAWWPSWSQRRRAPSRATCSSPTPATRPGKVNPSGGQGHRHQQEEEVGVPVGVDLVRSAVCRDDVGGDEVVDGEAADADVPGVPGAYGEAPRVAAGAHRGPSAPRPSRTARPSSPPRSTVQQVLLCATLALEVAYPGVPVDAADGPVDES